MMKTMTQAGGIEVGVALEGVALEGVVLSPMSGEQNGIICFMIKFHGAVSMAQNFDIHNLFFEEVCHLKIWAPTKLDQIRVGQWVW